MRKEVSDIELFCDEPSAFDSKAKDEIVRIRGWAIAESGIDHVSIQVNREPPQYAEYGLPRPDVQIARPLAGDAERSGFELKLDRALPRSGKHTIRIRAVARNGLAKEIRTVIFSHSAFASDYSNWIKQYEHREAFDTTSLESCRVRPLISILMPTYETPIDLLTKAIESVQRQTYDNWELCIADDASNSPELNKILEEMVGTDPRIRYTQRSKRGGIAAASNSAFELARGEFIALLDHDDELSPNALLYMVQAINKEPDAGLLYSDEDKIDLKGRRYDPFFKPDWSPDLFLSENYICHFTVMQRELMERAGLFRSEYDGSQDYDLFLRISRLTSKIVHIPQVLYHWRSSPGSTAVAASNKPMAEDAAKRAIEDHFRCARIQARVEPGRYPGRWRVRYEIPNSPRVSILIPSGGKLDVLRRNLDRLADKTEYPYYEIIVIDNSKGSKIEEHVRTWQHDHRNTRYLDCRRDSFNWSVLNNKAARLCDSELFLFLNDDTEVITSDWLTSMVELAMRPEVGVVGAKLLYPDGRIQHGGVVMGLFDNCGHAFKGLAGNSQHYFDLPDVIRNVSAVTGACLITRRNVFWELGGFDEEQFAVAFNDVDFCLRVGAAGYRVLYTPHALLYHYEAFSKTAKDLIPDSAEVGAMQTKWTHVIANDPYYNPNLTRSDEDYSLASRDSTYLVFRSRLKRLLKKLIQQ